MVHHASGISSIQDVQGKILMDLSNLTLVDILAVSLAIAILILAERRLYRRRHQRKEGLHEELSRILTLRGWTAELGLARRFLKVLDEAEMPIAATSVSRFYTCVHAFRRHDVTIYMAMLTPGADPPGRRSKPNASVVLAERIRSPIFCMICEQLVLKIFGEYEVASLHRSRDISPLCLHFMPSSSDVRQSRAVTAKICELTFGNTIHLFDKDRRAIIGKTGMIVEGPALSPWGGKIDLVELSRYLDDVEKLADQFPAVWQLIQSEIT